MTIPISIFSKKELKDRQPDEFIQAGDISVKEEGDEQVILSIRSVSNTPLALAFLIQEDLTSSFNLELKNLGNFIRRLPKGSRVMVAYLRGGTIQIRQKFTEDLEKAANSLRIVSGSTTITANSPYEGVKDALERFDALPSGRRALLLISDGLDTSNGIENSSPSQSLDLDQAILKAQRKSVAVYSIYYSTNLTANGNSIFSLDGQGSLNKLSEQTGGQAYFQGTNAPVSFDPFYKDLDLALNRQFALTYLSTHIKKGYYKIQVLSSNPDIKIGHPKGYYYR
jgi:VWFA-related protein